MRSGGGGGVHMHAHAREYAGRGALSWPDRSKGKVWSTDGHLSVWSEDLTGVKCPSLSVTQAHSVWPAHTAALCLRISVYILKD